MTPSPHVKRAAFALLRGLTVHGKQAADEPFLAGLRLIAHAATDDATARWVWKGALREMESPSVARRLSARSRPRKAGKP